MFKNSILCSGLPAFSLNQSTLSRLAYFDPKISILCSGVLDFALNRHALLRLAYFDPKISILCSKNQHILLNIDMLCVDFSVFILCPFAVYYLRYGVRSFFTMSRISLADGKTAGQKVHRKIAIAVQKVKTFVLFIPLF